MQTLNFVSGLHNCLEFSQPLSWLYQAMQPRKTFSIAKILKNQALLVEHGGALSALKFSVFFSITFVQQKKGVIVVHVIFIIFRTVQSRGG